MRVLILLLLLALPVRATSIVIVYVSPSPGNQVCPSYLCYALVSPTDLHPAPLALTSKFKNGSFFQETTTIYNASNKRVYRYSTDYTWLIKTWAGVKP